MFSTAKWYAELAMMLNNQDVVILVLIDRSDCCVFCAGMRAKTNFKQLRAVSERSLYKQIYGLPALEETLLVQCQLSSSRYPYIQIYGLPALKEILLLVLCQLRI